MKRFQKKWFVIVLILILSSCKTLSPEIEQKESVTTQQTTSNEDWQKALKSSFRKHYKTAVDSHTNKMLSSYPVITQDLLNMTLIRSNGERVRFLMDKKVYFTLAHTTHPPLTIYAILYPSNFQVNTSTLQELKDYNVVLEDAITGVAKIDHISKKQKQRLLTLLVSSNRYVTKIITDRKTTKEEYHNFAKSVRPLLEANLHDGAKEQLTQFLEQVNKWKTLYPEENWEELRVAVLGFHQPRDLYTLKLFFQWLLDEPEFERKVVFAEYQFSIFGDQREKAEELAIELLSKVNLEKEISLFMLGDETLLQKDVMGPAAEKILKTWKKTD